MNRILPLLVWMVTMAVTPFAICHGQAAEAVALDLEVDVTELPSDPVSFAISVKNTGNEPITVEHPRNRMAVSLILLDFLGNVILPEGRGKVHGEFREITIEPRSEYRYSLQRLEFLTGSALLGYTLNPGQTYRLIAVYRPRGQEHPGITSCERIFSVK